MTADGGNTAQVAPPSRALVTGASGFVGAAVAHRLAAGGASMRLLVRDGASRTNLAPLLELPGVETVTGNLDDPASLERAVQGCDAVFHVAADYRLYTRDPAAMYRTNVDGTVALMRAAMTAGAARVVFTSSVATLRPRADGSAADEDDVADEADMIGHYKRSKFLAERAVETLVRDEGLPAVIVSPAAPVGPRDVKPTPTGRTLLDASRGRMPAFVDTGLCIVHVDDVAAGHLLAHARGEVGRRYILGGENMTLREILAEVARLCGRPPPRVRIPHGVVMPLAWGSHLWAWLSGGEPAIPVDGVRMARKRMFFSSARAERELGYAPRPATQAIADALAWFDAHGYA